MKGKIKRMLAVLLALALCLGLAPAALAAPAANDVTQAIKDAIVSGGQYALPADSVLSNMITIGSGETLTLDLNGHTLTTSAGTRHFKVEAGGSLTLRDTGPGGSGKLQGPGGPGGVEVAGGTFRMEGGTITGCRALNGGGVYVGDGAFEMTGGTITDCSADNIDSATSGGGVYLAGGTFKLAGGTITGCSSGGNTDNIGGGGVAVDGGAFEMTGGTITGCTAKFGGGVYVGGGAFEMTGGSIAGCTASNSGGGVTVWFGAFKLAGGSITGCTVGRYGYGGGMYVFTGATLAVSGGPTVTGNTDDTGAANNVMLVSFGGDCGKIAVTGPLADGASLGVTLYGEDDRWANKEFLTGLPAGSKAFFPDGDPASYITSGTAGADGKLMAAPRVVPPVADTAISLDKTALELAPGETAKLKASLTPADATYKYIFWTSSDEAVAAVSDSGLVTAVSEGTATITAKSWYGHEAACTVTVKRAETPPPADPWPTEGLAGFVTRCYRVALGRDPDSAGHADWVRWLSDGTVNATSCAYGFVFSKEMNNKHLSDEAFVKTLYKLFMDREGEAAGVAFWTDYLKTGHGREEVFGGFADSVEFGRIKANFGIR